LQCEAPRDLRSMSSHTLEGKETILVVDDEEMVRLVIRAVLSYRGYTVVEVADGQAALRQLAERPGRIDLVLLDLNMPGMNGWELLRRLREADPAIPVIVLSGESPDEFAGRIIKAGAASVLQKPFDNLELLRQVRWTVDASRNADKPRAGAKNESD
jgi:two-component system, cell cycle sensor histidine kinase and response regulator CckA